MRTNKKMLLIASSVITILLFAIALSFLSEDEAEQHLAEYHVYQVRANDPLLFDGMVQAEEEQVEYIDPSLGVIAEIEVEGGDAVEVGDVLFSYTNEEDQQILNEQNRLHSRSINRLSESETELANSQNKLQTAEANITEINRQIEEYTPSEETEFGLDLELDELQSNLIEYETDKAEAETTIESAGIAIREFEEQIEDILVEIERLKGEITTIVEATVAGTVELNEPIVDNPPDVSEQPLLRILSDSVILEATVSEYDYDKLSIGSLVEVLLMNSDRRVNGEITTISSRPLASEGENSGSRYTFIVSPEESIQYGFSVQVSYQTDIIHLPEPALIIEEGNAYVFVYEDGAVEKREVSVQEVENTIVLEEGLSLEEEIVLEPLPELKDQEEIVIIND